MSKQASSKSREIMALKDHIPPTLHNAVGSVIAAVLIAALSGIYALLTHSSSVTLPWWLMTLCLVVVAGAFTWLILWFRHKLEKHEQPGRMIKSLGIKIDYPENNAIITGRTKVSGTIAKPIPKGYELCILRGYPEGGFVPDGYCLCDPDRKTWHVEQFDIGGESGNSRRIEAWLVGRDGRLLLDTWLAALQVHRVTNSRVEKLAPTERLTWLKPITKETSDMFRCDWINVKRG